MNFELTEERRLIRDTARDFAAREIAPKAAEIDKASATPPGWFGWLHHTTDTPPTQESYAPKAWEKPYQPNRTGTPQAYRPEGSALRSGRRPAATGDYSAWTPGN